MGTAVTTDRLDVWRDLIRDSFVALDIAADHEGFTGSVDSTTVGHLDVARVRSRSQGFTRTRDLAERDAETYLQVGLVARGTGVVTQDGRESFLTAGDFAIYETERPFHWGMKGDWELLVLTWPRAGIGLHSEATQGLTARRLDGQQGLGAIVGRMLRDVVDNPPELSLHGGLRLGDELAELVTTVATEQLSPTASLRSSDDLLHHVDAYLLDHLGDPDLSPATIAAAHFVSTRHLHRLFAGRGSTVSRHVQHLRLERTRLELAHPGCDDHTVTDIAARWGFADLATFSRAFRAAYGVTPTQYRASRGR